MNSLRYAKNNKENIKVSIVIPVLNGESTLSACLDAIFTQTIADKIEIIAIDSGSTDDSLKILKAYPAKLLQVAPTEFNHGITRNLGISQANGTYVLMTVQDASFASKDVLERMLKHFKDPNVAGVCGQQIVPSHKNYNPHQWFRPVSPPKVRKIKYESAQAFDKLTPLEKKQACGWDNVIAMYRKDVLIDIPFTDTFFAEDVIWARDGLRKGYTLVQDTAARVNHYHFLSYYYTYKRVLTQVYMSYKIFSLKRQLEFSKKEYLKIIYRNFRYRAHPKWIWHNINAVRARNKAFRDFHRWLEGGEDVLEFNFSATCRKPPQATSRWGNTVS